MLNLTVAVGTLIFYANVMNTNREVFFPFSIPNIINPEFGFDICYFDGMDAYWKTCLQLAFPTYIIFFVIIVSEHSSKINCSDYWKDQGIRLQL